jgi:sterol desaturase/sphingolipid hydroxylase (fatty acid hydroxylase superfamily)
MAELSPEPRMGGERLGVIGVLIGAAALVLALVTIYAGPFAPQQALSVSLGELAGETIKATARELFGRAQPEPVARVWTLDDTLQIVVVVAGVAAILSAVFAAFYGSKRVLIMGAAALGSAAIAVQFLAWAVVVIACALLVMAVFSLFGGGL